MREAAREVSERPGQYTVDIHGDPYAVRVGQARINAEELGRILQQDPLWRNRPIFLMACDAGQASDGVGQQLANALRVDVWAPTELAYSRPDGTVHSSSALAVSLGLPPDGKWVRFAPMGQGK